MLHIDYQQGSGRYIFYAEGMACTSTSSLPYFNGVDGARTCRMKEGVAYTINSGRYENDNSKFSCVGCPVRLF